VFGVSVWVSRRILRLSDYVNAAVVEALNHQERSSGRKGLLVHIPR